MCGIVPRRNNLQNAQTVVAVGNKSESAPRYHSDLYIVYFMHRIVGIENLIQPRSFWIFDIDDSQSTRACCDLYTMDTANPCSQGFQSGAPNDQKSGIIFFPGSAGLYKTAYWSVVSGSAAMASIKTTLLLAPERRDSKRPPLFARIRFPSTQSGSRISNFRAILPTKNRSTRNDTIAPGVYSFGAQTANLRASPPLRGRE